MNERIPNTRGKRRVLASALAVRDCPVCAVSGVRRSGTCRTKSDDASDQLPPFHPAPVRTTFFALRSEHAPCNGRGGQEGTL